MSSAGVLLAAGGGIRFHGATHKLVTDFRGRPLVSWAIAALSRVKVDEKIVVSGALPLAALVPEDFTLLENHDWQRGMAVSLRLALHWAELQGHDSVVVGLGDQPGVEPSAWELVLSVRKSPIAVATYGGERRNPVRLDRSIWSLLPIEGDDGARTVMRDRPELVTEVACEGSPFDIDTLEDLAVWT
ncbi:MAG: nucleotidyltransferase family protein [Acidimicrobiales bacterium]